MDRFYNRQKRNCRFPVFFGDSAKLLNQINHSVRPIESDLSTFEAYLRIPSVVVIYGNGRTTHASEHKVSTHLMRELFTLGRSGVRVRGILDSSRGVLSIASIRALNCYLRHGVQRFSHCSGRISDSPASRFAWADLCRVVNLRFQDSQFS